MWKTRHTNSLSQRNGVHDEPMEVRHETQELISWSAPLARINYLRYNRKQGLLIEGMFLSLSSTS